MDIQFESSLQAILAKALGDVAQATNPSELEQLRVHYLGKKGELTQQLKQIGSLPPEQRPLFGDRVNQVKAELAGALNERKIALDSLALEASIARESIDVSLAGRGKATGGIHPVTRTMQRIEDWFFSHLPIEGEL